MRFVFAFGSGVRAGDGKLWTLTSSNVGDYLLSFYYLRNAQPPEMEALARRTVLQRERKKPC